MNYLLFGIALFITAAAIVFVWGKTIPAKQEVIVNEKINAPIDRVWGIMTDWKNQGEWRSEVNKIVIVSPTTFIEQPISGPAITFEVVKLEQPKRIELLMTGSIQGQYIADLEFSDGVTTVTAREIVINDSIVGRVMSTLFFDLEQFAESYLQQVKTEVESQHT